MGNTTDIYMKFAGPPLPLALRVARRLETHAFFHGGDHVWIPVDATRWIDADGWGLLSLDPNEFNDGDAYGLLDPTEFDEEHAGTADRPYEYCLSLEYRGPRERLGRALFDQLTGLRVPLVIADPATFHVLADFLPGRGVREFPPGTNGEEAGRAQWFEPALHGAAPRSWQPSWPHEPPWPPRGRVIVFETEGLLQCVTIGEQGDWVTPKIAVRTERGPDEVGRVVAWAANAAARPHARDDERTAIRDSLGNAIRLSTGDFARGSVSVDVRAAAGTLTMIPRAPHPDGPLDDSLTGPTVEDLNHRGGVPDRPEDLGPLVLDLLGKLRHRAGPRPLDADRVVAALQRHVLHAGEDIAARRIEPDAVEVRTRWATYRAQRADWLVTRRPWLPGVVREAVRVVAREGIEDTAVLTYGLIFERHHQSESTVFLNDVTGLWTVLGRWLGVGLDPEAFAELIAEFHSGPDIDGPVVAAPAVGASTTAGGLIRDVDAFVADHPSVDPTLIATPTAREQDGAVELEFCSYHRYPTDSATAVDILSWRVARAAGKGVTWTRAYVARRVES